MSLIKMITQGLTGGTGGSQSNQPQPWQSGMEEQHAPMIEGLMPKEIPAQTAAALPHKSNKTVDYLDSLFNQMNGIRSSITKHAPLNQQNNNPGNIKDFGTPWDGMNNKPKTDGSFVSFQTPEMGVRALTKDLTTKMNRGLTDINQILNVYAPSSENDTQSYIDSVSQSTGLLPDQEITSDDFFHIIKGMIKHEGGEGSLNYFTDDIINKGMNLAYPDIYK